MTYRTETRHGLTVVAVALIAGMLSLSGGCGTQYGGRPSSIPRDVGTEDTTGTSGGGGGGGGGTQAPQSPGSGSGTGGSGAGTR